MSDSFLNLNKLSQYLVCKSFRLSVTTYISTATSNGINQQASCYKTAIFVNLSVFKNYQGRHSLLICATAELQNIFPMKSTKVQNPRRILHIICQYACAEIGHASRCSCMHAWCCQFSLQHGLAASVGIVLGKVECR